MPIGYRLTNIHIVDPFDKREKKIELRKYFEYSVFWDDDKKIQVIQMQLRSRRGSFSFIVEGAISEASNVDNKVSFVDSEASEIYLDEEFNSSLFDVQIKKSFLKHLIDSLILEPNFYGISIDIKNYLKKFWQMIL